MRYPNPFGRSSRQGRAFKTLYVFKFPLVSGFKL